MTRASLALILTSTLGLIVGSVIACGSEPSSGTFAQAAPAKTPVTINVVTTSNILADWVDEVGRDRVEVFSLAPVNSDLHTFQPGARDISRIADAGPGAERRPFPGSGMDEQGVGERRARSVGRRLLG